MGEKKKKKCKEIPSVGLDSKCGLNDDILTGKAPGLLSHSFEVLKSTDFQTALGVHLSMVHLLAWEAEDVVQALESHR